MPPRQKRKIQRGGASMARGAQRTNEIAIKTERNDVASLLRDTIFARRQAEGLGDIHVDFVPTGQRHELTPEEVEKKERRKEQNRRAARKCRQKKRALQGSVVEDFAKMAEDNRLMEQEIVTLRRQKASLENTLTQHLHSGDCRSIKAESPAGVVPASPPPPLMTSSPYSQMTSSPSAPNLDQVMPSCSSPSPTSSHHFLSCQMTAIPSSSSSSQIMPSLSPSLSSPVTFGAPLTLPVPQQQQHTSTPVASVIEDMYLEDLGAIDPAQTFQDLDLLLSLPGLNQELIEFQNAQTLNIPRPPPPPTTSSRSTFSTSSIPPSSSPPVNAVSSIKTISALEEMLGFKSTVPVPTSAQHRHAQSEEDGEEEEEEKEGHPSSNSFLPSECSFLTDCASSFSPQDPMHKLKAIMPRSPNYFSQVLLSPISPASSSSSSSSSVNQGRLSVSSANSDWSEQSQGFAVVPNANLGSPAPPPPTLSTARGRSDGCSYASVTSGGGSLSEPEAMDTAGSSDCSGGGGVGVGGTHFFWGVQDGVAVLQSSSNVMEEDDDDDDDVFPGFQEYAPSPRRH